MPGPGTLTEIGRVLPAGPYSVVLASLVPELTMPGDQRDYFANEAVATWGLDPYFGVPHSPRTPYYRLGTMELGRAHGGKRLGITLAVPLYPPTQSAMNHRVIIDRYRHLLAGDGSRPTALALGLVDDRGPAIWDEPPEFTRHLVVTLYLLDGHHKTLAASKEQLPLRFLVYFPHLIGGYDQAELVNAGLDFLATLNP